MRWDIIGSIGQWAACALLAAGIAIEARYKADLGFLAITVGSGLFAAATKLKYYSGRKGGGDVDHLPYHPRSRR